MSKIRNPLHYEIIPGPGTQINDWATMREKIVQVLPFATSIHIDLVDGKFANNKSFFDPKPFAEFADQVILEAHFMTDNPIQYIKPFADAGFKRFIGHIEKMPSIPEFVAEGELYGEVGLAIDGPTPLENLDLPLEDLDVVLIYTGERAGFSGATMMPDRLEKVKILRQRDPFIPIEIDGGVNDKTIVAAQKAGVTRFVSTGFIYGASNNSGDSLVSRFHTLENLLK